MKRVFLYILLFALSFFNSNKLFAGVEFNVYIPFGVSLTYINSTVKNKDYVENSFKKFYDRSAAETGILIGGGYNFEFKNPIIESLSLMLDIGYYMAPVSISYVHSVMGITSETTLLHTLNTGLALKLYFYSSLINLYYSVTLAGGVKTPFGGNVLNNSAFTDESILYGKDAYGYGDIRNLFKTPVIGYLKYSIDFYYMLTEKVSIMYGLYASYDFGMNYNTEYLNSSKYLKDYANASFTQAPVFGSLSYNNVSAGIIFGLSFGKTHAKVKYGY
ncbi:Conserved hypothetical secreted protein [Brachyspira suanatina]|uniref:Conserved hypothetical secreted protein n=1 Tax=Brachyspira suanatina TaxID=381802 RepID=A0A0G4KAL2_9SPIR|nr:hypothetical protein [Brachyspira suanatina]CRF35118.1 Conserved hypothetical secreted protein [Brachyspira suanatina]